METFLIILKFFGGFILIIAVSWLIRKLFKLDEYDESLQVTNSRNQKKE